VYVPASRCTQSLLLLLTYSSVSSSSHFRAVQGSSCAIYSSLELAALCRERLIVHCNTADDRLLKLLYVYCLLLTERQQVLLFIPVYAVFCVFATDHPRKAFCSRVVRACVRAPWVIKECEHDRIPTSRLLGSFAKFTSYVQLGTKMNLFKLWGQEVKGQVTETLPGEAYHSSGFNISASKLLAMDWRHVSLLHMILREHKSVWTLNFELWHAAVRCFFVNYPQSSSQSAR